MASYPSCPSGRPLAAALLALLFGLLSPGGVALAADSAVVFLYHRFGETDFPSTDIRLDQFEAHIEELEAGGYTVMPVPEIVKAVREGRPLPELAVGITIDDAYLSVYEEAWPRLRAAGLPFTLFVATDPIDQGFEKHMTWDQIRELAAAGVTIGAHTASHLHLVEAGPEQAAADMARAVARLRAELGEAPALFAYPYGEISLEIRDKAVEAGYTAAFGQESGVIHRSQDFYNLPRFALTEQYGGIEQFRLRARVLPLSVRDVAPRDRVVTTNRPNFGFTVDPGIGSLDGLACYASGQGRTRIERLGRRIEVRLAAPLGPGRTRINCTMPGPEGRWRWLGTLFYVPPG